MNFVVFKKTEVIAPPLFDACASWWTQGPDATLQAELAREVDILLQDMGMLRS